MKSTYRSVAVRDRGTEKAEDEDATKKEPGQ